MTTWPLLTLTAPPPCPESAFTSCWWATVLTWIQALANRGLVMILCTWLWMNPATALAIDGPNDLSSVPTRDRPLLVSRAAA